MFPNDNNILGCILFNASLKNSIFLWKIIRLGCIRWGTHLPNVDLFGRGGIVLFFNEPDSTSTHCDEIY